MILIAGHLKIREGEREAFLADSQAPMRQARETPGCLDFVVAADPLDVNRVNIFERWATREALDAFRGSGPDGPILDLIESANVREHDVEG